MRVGIIGSGDVGQALGRGFAALGYDVKLGTRDPASAKVTAWAAKVGAHASTGTFAEAAQFGDLAVVATAWHGTKSALDLAGPAHLAGKVVIDTTNPLDFGPAGPALALGFSDSAGEQVQRWLPRARVVKAFNIVGNPHMFRPQFKGGPPDMFIAGDDAAAKGTVGEILTAFGWRTVDLGGLTAARYLEPLAMVWITHMFKTGSGDHAFAFLRK